MVVGLSLPMGGIQYWAISLMKARFPYTPLARVKQYLLRPELNSKRRLSREMAQVTEWAVLTAPFSTWQATVVEGTKTSGLEWAGFAYLSVVFCNLVEDRSVCAVGVAAFFPRLLVL